MTRVTHGAAAGSVRHRLRQALNFARAAEPRAPLSRRAQMFDLLLAAVLVTAALASSHEVQGTAPLVVLNTAALAARRRFPLAVFAVVVLAAIAVPGHATYVTFAAILIAGYSAALHSRFRPAALLSLIPAGVAVAAAFWTTGSAPGAPVGSVVSPLFTPGSSKRPAGYTVTPFGGTLGQTAPWRVVGVLVLVSLASIAVAAGAVYAGNRIRRLQGEHEQATHRALETERARIAAELHDVVSHNVSVMIVQAGAARQVLNRAPDQAREALLAVESSGRDAMAELRNLLGLLSPPDPADPPGPGDQPAAGDHPGLAALSTVPSPQPGLAQLRPLIDRVSAAGLPAGLAVTGTPRALPPGQDLAAYRVVQEALTNVLKHAGQAPTAVAVEYRAAELIVEIADSGRPEADPPGAGRPAGAAIPRVPAGTGRGLLGLRERMALYGGELDAGPRLGGGWRVRARIPLAPGPARPDPAVTTGPASAGPSPAEPTGARQ